MEINIVRIEHKCSANLDTVRADVERSGEYWWGLVGKATLQYSMNFCPYCGEKLPEKEAGT